MTDNDDLPTQELPEVLMGDAEEILLDLIDLISKAANVPLLTDVVVDEHGHEQFFTVLDSSTGVQLGFISRTGNRVPMNGQNVRALFRALGDA